jgi:hypothetical protein
MLLARCWAQGNRDDAGDPSNQEPVLVVATGHSNNFSKTFRSAVDPQALDDVHAWIVDAKRPRASASVEEQLAASTWAE